MLSQTGKESIQQTKTEVNNLLQEVYRGSNNPFDKMIGEAYASQARAQEELIKQAEKLDESQKKIVATLLDHHKILVDNTVAQVQYAREVQLSENAVIKNSVGKEDYSKTVKFLLDEMTSEYSKAGLFSSLQSNLFGDFSEFDLIIKDNAKKNQ